MKAQIETTIQMPQGMQSAQVKAEMLGYFAAILNAIQLAQNERELRHYMNNVLLIDKTYFEFGFGGSHMWVHQVIDGQTQPNRLIFVQF